MRTNYAPLIVDVDAKELYDKIYSKEDFESKGKFLTALVDFWNDNEELRD